jgi:catechol 2,3-dioxygenase-like lactoylglutathione lyase family enzyme
VAKIKHIALASQDPEATAAFFEEALGLQRISRVNSPLAEGFYLTDGSINIAVLKYRNDEAADVPEGAAFVGLHHIGFKVDDLDEAYAKLETAKADKRPEMYPPGPNRTFEVKFKSPDGVLFDISHLGWPGAGNDEPVGM